MTQTEASIEREMSATFTSLMPADWKTSSTSEDQGFDKLFVVSAPDGARIRFALDVKRTVAPRDVPRIARQLRATTQRLRSPVELVVAAPYLSDLSRAALEREGLGYLDVTGNVLLRCSRPALYIKSAGASRDPNPSSDKLQSLKGTGTWRAVRALVDFRPPFGIRELAQRASVPLGTLSRTVDVLDRDGLIQRAERGPIERVDVNGVIRRWAQDYSVTGSNQVVSALASRGISAFRQQLLTLGSGYAATGAFAAAQFAPVAPTRLATVYVTDPARFGEQRGLRPVDSGANVWLIEPASDVVFDRTSERGGLVCVAATQLAVDLLTGPGRDPAEGEELLRWMEANENEWRA